MALFSLDNVAIKGIASCVPKNVDKIEDYPLFSHEEAMRFSASTGIYQRRRADTQTTASDLCYHAAEKLISQLKWTKDNIDVLIFVSQTPDYILPSTSCILQNRLGLSIDTYAIDISLGCPGWIYGFSTMTQLLAHGGMKRGLLLAGETTSKLYSEFDKTAYPLFGDAGTATAVEFDINAKTSYFHHQTDGGGFKTIFTPDGGYRNPTSEKSLIYEDIADGVRMNRLHNRLNGMDVFAFGTLRVPQTVDNILDFASIKRENIDYYLFNQTNMFMNERIRKKLRLNKEQVPYSLKEFGNTSSATIPLTMTTQIREQLQHKNTKLIACSFGVGLSWGSVYFETNEIVCPEIIVI